MRFYVIWAKYGMALAKECIWNPSVVKAIYGKMPLLMIISSF